MSAKRPEVKFTLDGREVSLPEGTPVIEAAKQLGTEIPHYCYHPALGNPGVCRLCIVEVEGMPKPQVSCRLPAKAGLVVRSNSPGARRAQAASLEFHLQNHPLDCPVCDQAGECWLQDYYQRFGLYQSAVKEDKRHKPKRVEIGNYVMLDAERCILCTRCTRFLDNVTKTGEMGIFNHGDRSVIDVYPGRRVDNPYSGNVVDVCPVGALTDKDFRFAVRVWYLDRTPSVCTGCARGCSIEVHSNTKRPWHFEGRRVARFKPRHNPQVNGWWMCDEGRYSYKKIDDKSRIKGASVLQDGKPVYVAPAEAARRAAGELKRLVQGRGAEGLAVVLSGTLSNEDLFAAKALFAGALKPGHLLVRPGPDQLGEEDELLRRKEKVPNHRGAELLGFGSAVRESTWERIRQGVADGGVWGLYVVDRDPVSVWGASCPQELAGLPFTLYQGANANRFALQARWVLPSCSFAEEYATFTNFQGIVQRAALAVPPLGDSRPDWAIFRDMLAELGGEALPEEPRALFAALCRAEPAFQGLGWEKLDGLGMSAAAPGPEAPEAMEERCQPL